MKTVRELIKEAESKLDDEHKDVNVAKVLFYHLAKKKPNEFYLMMNEEVEPELEKAFLAGMEEYYQGKPIQYIKGCESFFGRDFKVNEDVLIPRQDTELLVEMVLNYLKQKIQGKKVKVLDMCTGSGCIAISIKKLAENVDVTAVDLSQNALKVAIDNAKQLDAKVTFIESDLFENVSGKYDIIVSNPPYIRKSDIETLMEEVKNHEPMMALDGDEDGLIFYKKISEKLNEYLSDDGMIFYEIGYDQGKTVPDILKQYNFKDINVYKDLSGNDRVVIARKGEENV